MRLLDVNVLVYAHREDAPDHAAYRRWLEDALAGDEPIGITTQVLTGFVRVVTHRRVFDPPTPARVALEFASRLRDHPACVSIEPAGRHWDLFVDLCDRADARGNLVTDAALAATALEACTAVAGPRVAVLGRSTVVVPVAGLDALAAGVARATGTFGAPPEARAFRGHLTLARVRRGSARMLAGEALEVRFPVEDVRLVRSRLGPGGARYDDLAVRRLDRPAPGG